MTLQTTINTNTTATVIDTVAWQAIRDICNIIGWDMKVSPLAEVVLWEVRTDGKRYPLSINAMYPQVAFSMLYREAVMLNLDTQVDAYCANYGSAR